MGIMGVGGVEIATCKVTATAGTALGSESATCSGIQVENGSLSIANAVVIANGGTTQGDSYGINVASNALFITNSNVIANGGMTTNSSYGIKTSSATRTINKSIVIATGNTSALSLSSTPPITGGLTASASTEKSGNGAAAVTLDESIYSDANTYKYVRITPQARWGTSGSDFTGTSLGLQYGTLAEAISYVNWLSGGEAYIQLLTNIDKTTTAHGI